MKPIRELSIPLTGRFLEEAPLWMLRPITRDRPSGAQLHGFTVIDQSKTHICLRYDFTPKGGSVVESTHLTIEIPEWERTRK